MSDSPPEGPPPMLRKRWTVGPRLRRTILHWYSVIPLIEREIHGLRRERLPEGNVGWSIIDWWTRGVHAGRPMEIKLGMATLTSNTLAINISSIFRGAPISRTSEREMPLFYLGNQLGWFRMNPSLSPPGFGELLITKQILEAWGKPFPMPRTFEGLRHQYVLYASYPQMAKALESPTWQRPFQQAEELTGGIGLLGFSSEQLLCAWGGGSSFSITIPLDLKHSPDYYLSLLKAFLSAVATIEDSFDAENIESVPLMYDKLAPQEGYTMAGEWAPLVKCPTCGDLEKAITAFEPGETPRRISNMMTMKCRRVIYSRPSSAPAMVDSM